MDRSCQNTNHYDVRMNSHVGVASRMFQKYSRTRLRGFLGLSLPSETRVTGLCMICHHDLPGSKKNLVRAGQASGDPLTPSSSLAAALSQ